MSTEPAGRRTLQNSRAIAGNAARAEWMIEYQARMIMAMSRREGDHRRIGLGNSVVSGSDLGQVLVVNHGPSTGIEGAVDRYVAMTRVTQQLVILTTRDVGQK
jgi:hypothetical protein